jgi:hypothetical protein
VNLLVSSKVAALREGPVTLIALVGLLSGMAAHVDLKGARAHELVIALFADIGSLTRVSSLVIGQVALGREGHVAVSEVTLEWLLPIVNSHVSEQVALLSEGFLASLHLAYERALSCL